MPVSIILPTLNRSSQLRKVLNRLVDTTTKGVTETIVIVDAEDYDSVKVCADVATHPENSDFHLRCISMEGSPFGVEKWNEGAKRGTYNHIGSTWLALVADDLEFPDNWLADSLECENEGFLAFRDTEGSCKFYEPHYMATVDWLKKYNGGVLAVPHYKHWGIDVEIASKARTSGTYRVAKAVLKHNHVLNSGAMTDSTYEKGETFHVRDMEMFNLRRIDNFPNNFKGYL